MERIDNVFDHIVANAYISVSAREDKNIVYSLQTDRLVRAKPRIQQSWPRGAHSRIHALTVGSVVTNYSEVTYRSAEWRSLILQRLFQNLGCWHLHITFPSKNAHRNWQTPELGFRVFSNVGTFIPPFIPLARHVPCK